MSEEKKGYPIESLSLVNLIDMYGRKKAESNKLYSDYKNGLVELSELKFVLQSKLEATGLKSAKSSAYGVSIATKPSIRVENELSVIDWLKNTPNIEYDFYIGLKQTAFKPFALQVLKETGEIIPGTEMEMKESLTIRSNEKNANSFETQ